MRQTKLFTKTRKEAPADETSKNAELLIRAGFVHKEMAGAYSYLPLGLRVLKNVEKIIREEMDAIGGQELVMTALQRKDVWEKVGRWDDDLVDVWFKTKLKDGAELGLGFTHDEQVVNLLTEYVNSYKDLPLYVYQIQTKFRNELRAKSGVMRGREFVMKDLYSFDTSEEAQDVFYEKVKKAYMKIYSRCGIGHKTYITLATGGTFSQYSHEFQTISEAGEDVIFLDEEKNIAVNQEITTDEELAKLGIEKKNLVEHKSVEVGNIFKQGTKFTDPFDLKYKDSDGEIKSIYMGGYGIGVTRLIGVIAEVLSDDKGIIWPKEIAPFAVHLIAAGNDENVLKTSEEMYTNLTNAGIEVLFDDREVGAGEKFNDSDLIGIPLRVVVGKRSLEAGEVEIKERRDEKTKMVKIESIVDEIKNYV